ncbi:MAG: hypothetical protein U5K69_09220 [Balneolaceae bacterium]|nr:hypothetical protein [Balneolaceae bacterium]
MESSGTVSPDGTDDRLHAKDHARFVPGNDTAAAGLLISTCSTWKHYASENVTERDANDDQPMWHGSTLYFASDRGPDLRYNIWAYDQNTGDTRQVTNFENFDIHFPAIGPSEMVFEAGGTLYLMDLESEETRPVDVDVVTDQTSLKPRTENVNDLIQNAFIAPDGKRVLFQARGDTVLCSTGTWPDHESLP